MDWFDVLCSRPDIGGADRVWALSWMQVNPSTAKEKAQRVGLDVVVRDTLAREAEISRLAPMIGGAR